MKTKDGFTIGTVMPPISDEFNLHKEFKRMITKAVKTSKTLEIAAGKLGISERSLIRNMKMFDIQSNQGYGDRLSRLKGELNEKRIKFETINDNTLWFTIKDTRFDVSRENTISEMDVTINNAQSNRKSLVELILIIDEKLK